MLHHPSSWEDPKGSCSSQESSTGVSVLVSVAPPFPLLPYSLSDSVSIHSHLIYASLELCHPAFTNCLFQTTFCQTINSPSVDPDVNQSLSLQILIGLIDI